ncbi:hypothetical protein G6011_10299 [Alternaria panax]|uniref:Uncharacterized protein n=1 Tax=Alternaria panax TaxID=48097 RepID=A0AAD4IBM3_9PLEO|nr:hypothetical protein G6011_10299 [Alternaria panax]
MAFAVVHDVAGASWNCIRTEELVRFIPIIKLNNSATFTALTTFPTTTTKTFQPRNIIRGHKANLNNPNTSDESKQHSKEVLQEIENGSDANAASSAGGDKNPNNVAGGLKATLNNPNTSNEAKQSARERLGQEQTAVEFGQASNSLEWSEEEGGMRPRRAIKVW